MQKQALVWSIVLVVLLGGGWLLCQGPRAALVAQEPKLAAGEGKWELRLKRVGLNQYEAMRFSRTTGESWQLTGDEWKKVGEAAPPPPGDYEIQIAGEEADPGVMVIRLDRQSGKSWRRSQLKWFPLLDAKS